MTYLIFILYTLAVFGDYYRQNIINTWAFVLDRLNIGLVLFTVLILSDL